MKKHIHIIITGLILTFGIQLLAQQSRSIYFLEETPQSTALNPSFIPNHKFYVSLPIFSSFYIGFENQFSFDDFTAPKSNGKLFIDRDELISKLGEKNYFSFETAFELGRMGMKIGKGYIHLSYTI